MYVNTFQGHCVPAPRKDSIYGGTFHQMGLRALHLMGICYITLGFGSECELHTLAGRKRKEKKLLKLTDGADVATSSLK